MQCWEHWIFLVRKRTSTCKCGRPRLAGARRGASITLMVLLINIDWRMRSLGGARAKTAHLEVTPIPNARDHTRATLDFHSSSHHGPQSRMTFGRISNRQLTPNMRARPRPLQLSRKNPPHGHHIYAYCNVRTNQVLYSLRESLRVRMRFVPWILLAFTNGDISAVRWGSFPTLVQTTHPRLFERTHGDHCGLFSFPPHRRDVSKASTLSKGYASIESSTNYTGRRRHP